VDLRKESIRPRSKSNANCRDYRLIIQKTRETRKRKNEVVRKNQFSFCPASSSSNNNNKRVVKKQAKILFSPELNATRKKSKEICQ